MNKKIAIIYTGEVRTIEKTIEYFKKNVVINENYHVFAVLQTNNIEYFDIFVKNNIGENLKCINWFDKNDEWNEKQEKILSQMTTVSDDWKGYIRNSGSIIEYYQMYLAYKDIEEYEKKNYFYYDYILRIRCDVILTQPLYFDWYDFTLNDVKSLLYEIKEINDFKSIKSIDVLNIFMNSIYHKNRILCKNVSFSNNLCSEKINKIISKIHEDNEDILNQKFVELLLDYIVNGDYAITIRKNQIYFIKRKLFTNISKLGITYGESHKMENNFYWFNAESQLFQICRENGVDIFDSTTVLEEKSIYNYNENNYFENNVLKKSNDFSFFIRRN